MVQDLWGYKHKWKGVLGPKSKCFGAHFFDSDLGLDLGFGIFDLRLDFGFWIRHLEF